MNELTPRQNDVYLHLVKYVRENGNGPTLREIMAALGFASTNAVRQHLERLAKKGFIERNENISRGIKIIGNRAGRSIPLVENLQVPFSGLSDRDKVESIGQIAVGAEFSDTVFAYKVKDGNLSAEGIHENDHLIVDSAGECEIGQLALIKPTGEVMGIRRLTRYDLDQNRIGPGSEIFIGKLLELSRVI